MEISCLLEGCLVHVLALGFELDHAALDPYRQGQAAVGEALTAAEAAESMPQAGWRCWPIPRAIASPFNG